MVLFNARYNAKKGILFYRKGSHGLTEAKDTGDRPLASAGVVPGGQQAGSSAAGVWGPEPDRLGW